MTFTHGEKPRYPSLDTWSISVQVVRIPDTHKTGNDRIAVILEGEDNFNWDEVSQKGL